MGTMFISTASLAALPTTGTPWSRLTAKSTTDPGAGNLGIIDQLHPLAVFSIALRWARDGGGLGKQRVIDEISSVAGTESSAAQPLNPYRVIGAYILAADLVDMPGSTVVATGQTFDVWLASLANKIIPGQTNWNTLWKCADISGNNWGACARTSLMAIALWQIKQGNTTVPSPADGCPTTWVGVRDAVLQRFRRWCGDTTVANTFVPTGSFLATWDGPTTTFPTTQGVINPDSSDLTRNGANCEDASRTGTAPPLTTGDGIHYQYECLDSALVMIAMLIRAGYATAGAYGNNGVKRNFQFMTNNGLDAPGAGGGQYGHQFYMHASMANFLFGLSLPIPTQDGYQRRMLTTHTDWLTSSGSTWLKTAGGGGAVVTNPTASFTTSQSGQTVTVNAAGTAAGSGAILRHVITWGDGSTTTTLNEPTRTASHTYTNTAPTTYTISVQAVASDGGAATATRSVTVSAANGAPVGVFTSLSPLRGFGATVVSYDVSGSFDPEGSAITRIINWGDGTTTTAAPATGSHTYADVSVTTSYTVTLTVSDGTLTSAPVKRTVTIDPVAAAAVVAQMFVALEGVKIPIAASRDIEVTTANRPAASGSIRRIYDVTLGKPLWSNGTVWKDASGVTA